jgi:hypothetical protein
MHCAQAQVFQKRTRFLFWLPQEEDHVKRVLFALLLVTVAFSLAACSGGPSKKEAKEAIYGVTLHEGIVIVSQKKCDLKPDLPAELYQNPYLVRYRTEKGGDKVSETLLYETDEGWRMAVGLAVQSACKDGD